VTRIIRWAFTIITFIIGVIITTNIQKLLEGKGWDKFFLKYWPTELPNMPDFSYLIESKCFWLFFGFSAGIAMALWIIRLWPEKERAKERSRYSRLLKLNTGHATSEKM